MSYATGTEVPIERSKQQIESLLAQRGAEQFYSAWEKEGRAMVAFRHSGRMVRLELRMPDEDDPRYICDRNGRRKPPAKARAALEAEHRRRWRSLLLIIKAKFEAIETGITTFEDEFMASVMTADGKTVGEYMRPQLAEMYESGKMPSLLLPGVAGGGRRKRDGDS